MNSMLEIPTRKDCFIILRHFLDLYHRVHPSSGLQPYLSSIKARIRDRKGQISQRFAPTQLNRLSIPYDLRAPQLPNTPFLRSPIPDKSCHERSIPPHRRLPCSSPSHPAPLHAHQELLDDGREDNIPIRTPITKLASTTHGAFADSGAMSGRAWLFDWVSGKLVLDMVVGRCSSPLSFPSA